MQFNVPASPPARFGEWVRQRTNFRLYKLCGEPLQALRGTEHDAWSFDGKGPVFTPNPVWEAARKEFERRYDLYQRCVPLKKWGIA